LGEVTDFVFWLELPHDWFRECNDEFFRGLWLFLWRYFINHGLIENGSLWLKDLINLPLDLFFMFLLILYFLLELPPIVGIDEKVELIPLDD
jgi:hypothetical protein